jgi:hypothetical protein
MRYKVNTCSGLGQLGDVNFDEGKRIGVYCASSPIYGGGPTMDCGKCCTFQATDDIDGEIDDRIYQGCMYTCPVSAKPPRLKVKRPLQASQNQVQSLFGLAGWHNPRSW